MRHNLPFFSEITWNSHIFKQFASRIKMQIEKHGCIWIIYLLTIKVWQFLLNIFRFWGFLIVTCLSTLWPQRVMLYATHFWLRLQSIFGNIPYQFMTFLLLYSIESGTCSNFIAFHKAESHTQVWNYAICHTFLWENWSFDTNVWIFNKKYMLTSTCNIF